MEEDGSRCLRQHSRGRPAEGTGSYRGCCCTRRKRMGPLKLAGSTGCPFWVISITPDAASSRPASRVSSMRSRQRPGKARRGASEGQQVAPGLRERSRPRIVSCSTRSSVPCSQPHAGGGTQTAVREIQTLFMRSKLQTCLRTILE